MKITRIVAITLGLVLNNTTVALSCPCSEMKLPSAPPESATYELGLNFSKTSQYKREFLNAVHSAKAYCVKYKREHPEETNLAIVSDIDETVLDNRPHFRRHPERNWEVFDKWLQESKAPVLQPTYDFLKWAREQGFAIFFVTGRPEADRKPTIINLVRNQISYDGLYLREKHGGPPAEIYKTAVREQIEKMGFKIVVNIGDQFSDLVGEHSLDCEKLPNKMYFIK